MFSKIKSLYKTFAQHASNSWESIRIMYSAVPVYTTIAIVLVFISAGVPFLSSRVLAEIIDKFTQAVSKGEPIQSILYIIVVYIGIGIVGDLLSRIRSFVSSVSDYKFKTNYEFKDLNHRLDNIDIGREEDPKYKDLHQKISQHKWAITNMSGMFIKNLLPNILNFFIALIILSSYNLWVALLAIVGAVPQLISKLKADNQEYSIWNSSGGRGQRVYYTLRGYVHSKIFRGEQQQYGSGNILLNKIKDLYDKFEGLIYRERRKRILYDSVLDVVGLVAMGASMILLTQNVFAGVIQVGILVFLFQTYSRFDNSLIDFITTLAYYFEESRHVTDLREWYKVKPVIKTPHPVSEIPSTNSLNIEIKNVSFHYPHDEKIILKNLNLNIRHGEKIGIVGNNGSGKSTFIKLLSRVYDPSEGDIYVNGVNLKNIPPQMWFKNISALFQNYGTYEYTIRESISVSVPEDTDTANQEMEARVVLAGKQSTADDFIQKLNKKYDEQIGAEFGGLEPSGGQKQKIALARTFYRKAPIMILDEPTAAIDTESELNIYKTLDELPSDQTVIFISHDFSTIRRADRILVFQDGEIIEDGTHEELLAMNGTYGHLYNKQKEAYE